MCREIHVLEAIRENSTREMKELIDETIRDTFKDQDSKRNIRYLQECNKTSRASLV